MIPLENQIQQFANLSYLGIFFAVIFSGHIVPFPEDIILILVGYIAALHVVKLPLAIIVSTFGIVIADIILYFLSLHGNKFVLKIEKKFPSRLFNRYIEIMKSRTFLVMTVSRFVPGLRILNPLVAGVIKISSAKFIIFTILSSAIYTPLLILLGYAMHSQIIPLLTKVETLRHVLFWTIIIIGGTGLTIYIHKKYFSSN